MHIILWQYAVDPAHRAEFERTYGPQGEWAGLFRRAEGYLGTSLLREVVATPIYLTVDRWTNAAAYRAFLAAWEPDYRALDERSRTLTAREVRLGSIETDQDFWSG
ncbi:MAG: antibiotic biosynthesis monooxygenase family protein [Anaerolineales bacterium]